MKAKARILRIDPYWDLSAGDIVDVERASECCWLIQNASKYTPDLECWTDKLSMQSEDDFTFPLVRLIAGTLEA